MGSLVPLAVRIDVSRLIDRSQPFKAAWPPQLAPEPPDFIHLKPLTITSEDCNDAEAPRLRDFNPRRMG
jgi:hypothetical protein